MSIRWPVPRLLPLTIAALTGLLLLKSAEIVRAAAPSADTLPPTAPPAAAPPAAAPPAAKPAAAPAAAARAAAAPASATKPAPAQEAAATAPSDPPPPPVSEAERTLLQDLRQRRAELDGREAAIGLRENVLASAEKRLSARVAELTALQQRLESLETARRERDEKSWAGLVKVYETMKPRDAAAIFNDLDMNVLLQVLDRMKESKAAPVLAAMQPDRARLATADLAQLRSRRNAVPPAAPPAGKPAP
jgi:flagellar motility protein MotE (MotC chaperone)